MKNENLVILLGNLTRDPELRHLANGTAVVTVRLAVSDSYKTNSGDYNTIATYVNCEAWDSAAELISSTLKKGDAVFVRGSLRMDEWEKDGVKRTSLKVRVNSFTPVSRRPKDESGSEETADVKSNVNADAQAESVPF